MEKININLIRLAKKYADSIYEIAKVHNEIENVLNSLFFVVDELKNEELNSFLTNKIISSSDKKPRIPSGVFWG